MGMAVAKASREQKTESASSSGEKENRSGQGPDRLGAVNVGQRGFAPPANPSARDVLRLQRTVGNRATARLLRTEGPPDGAADRPIGPSAAQVQAKPSPERNAAGDRFGLPPNLQAGVEALSGVSMRDVRVRYRSPEPARVQAKAFAVGKEIHLAPGQEAHLPHEAWHVAQQKQGRVQRTFRLGGAALNAEPALEQEADVQGRKAARVRLGDGPARLLSPGLRRSPVMQMVQDNRDHHQAFLQEKVGVKDPKTDNAYAAALAAAIVLDHHLYRVRTPSVHTPALQQLALLNFDLTKEPDFYHDLLTKYIEQQTTRKLSDIHWAAPAVRGGYLMGTAVDARFHEGGQAEGNPTQKAVPWMEALKARRDGDGTLYVMGHLLNADLGGPSLDYNYVPLTGRAGWHGANGANRLHSELMEQIVKDKVDRLGAGVTSVHYAVQADYNRAPRNAQIGALENALSEMDVIAQTMLKQHKTDITKGALNRKDTDAKEKLRNLIGSNAALDVALRAVASGNYWSRGWTTLKQLMADNIKLWKLEDAIVPASLKILLEWDQDGIAQSLSYQVPIDLPTALGAPFRGAVKSGGTKDDPQKHSQQFHDFLLSNLNPKNDVDAAVASFLLDRQQYEIDQIADLAEQWALIPELEKKRDDVKTGDEERERIQFQIETIREVAGQYADGIPRLRGILNSDPHRKKLFELLSGKKEEEGLQMGPVFKLFSGGLSLTPKEQSKLKWSGETPIGSAEQILAQFAPKGHAKGSSAGGASKWMSVLEQRRFPGDSTVYVRGHMLNRHLGGPGLDWNMVPLTGRSGWFGANNANAIHSSGIEELVKNLYDSMAGPDDRTAGAVTGLMYRVKAVFGNHNRPQTKLVAQAFQDFKLIEAGLKSLSDQRYQKMGGEEIKGEFVRYTDEDFTKLLQSNPAQAKMALISQLYAANPQTFGTGGDPVQQPLLGKIIDAFKLTDDVNLLRQVYFNNLIRPKFGTLKLEQARAMISQRGFSDTWRKKLADLDQSSLQTVRLAIQSKGLLGAIIRASCATDDYEEFSLHAIGDRLNSNAQLWQFEDAYVPLHLEVEALWSQDGQTQKRLEIIPNVLPSDVRAPFDPRVETNEDF